MVGNINWILRIEMAYAISGNQLWFRGGTGSPNPLYPNINGVYT